MKSIYYLSIIFALFVIQFIASHAAMALGVNEKIDPLTIEPRQVLSAEMSEKIDKLLGDINKNNPDGIEGLKKNGENIIRSYLTIIKWARLEGVRQLYGNGSGDNFDKLVLIPVFDRYKLCDIQLRNLYLQMKNFNLRLNTDYLAELQNSSRNSEEILYSLFLIVDDVGKIRELVEMNGVFGSGINVKDVIDFKFSHLSMFKDFIHRPTVSDESRIQIVSMTRKSLSFLVSKDMAGFVNCFPDKQRTESKYLYELLTDKYVFLPHTDTRPLIDVVPTEIGCSIYIKNVPVSLGAQKMSGAVDLKIHWLASETNNTFSLALPRIRFELHTSQKNAIKQLIGNWLNSILNNDYESFAACYDVAPDRVLFEKITDDYGAKSVDFIDSRFEYNYLNNEYELDKKYILLRVDDISIVRKKSDIIEKISIYKNIKFIGNTPRFSDWGRQRCQDDL